MLGEGRPTTGRPKKFSSRSGRDRTLTIRCTEQDLSLLKRSCEFYGVTQTDYILFLIREGWRTIESIKEQKTSIKSPIE